jgi:hypothetical protein
MYAYGAGVLIWCGASALRHPGTSATRLQILSIAPVFLSMALFGLYTGEISIRSVTLHRDNNPAGFWVYFAANLIFAAIWLFMGLT